MTGDQIVAATDRYDRELEKEEIPIAEHPHDIVCMMRRAALAHLRTMFPKWSSLSPRTRSRRRCVGSALSRVCSGFVESTPSSNSRRTTADIPARREPPGLFQLKKTTTV